jgi:hypothetical protein
MPARSRTTVDAMYVDGTEEFTLAVAADRLWAEYQTQQSDPAADGSAPRIH